MSGDGGPQVQRPDGSTLPYLVGGDGRNTYVIVATPQDAQFMHQWMREHYGRDVRVQVDPKPFREVPRDRDNHDQQSGHGLPVQQRPRNNGREGPNP